MNFAGLRAKIGKVLGLLQHKRLFLILCSAGVAASVEHEKVLCSLDCNCVVDIGANRGQFALMARELWPHAKIYSFEPLQEPASILLKVFKTDPLMRLFPLAIGSAQQKTVIHVSRQDDSSSLLPMSAQQATLFPGTEEKETRVVEVCRLDDVLVPEDIVHPALLKLDVQGFEKEALEGCKALLPHFAYVYVECSFAELYTGQALAHEIIAWLASFGFLLAGIYNLYYDEKGLSIQGDFLFTKAAS